MSGLRQAKFIFPAVIALLTLSLSLTACGSNARDATLSREAQNASSERAFAAVPPYIPNEYTAREDINWYLQETEGRHTWYVYALSMTGEPLFYIVRAMKPRNICVSITAPDRLAGGSSGYAVRNAPALDGVYYGGAGCNAYYMRDAATGGGIELAGDTFTLVSSKTPLFLETDIRRLGPGNGRGDQP